MRSFSNGKGKLFILFLVAALTALLYPPLVSATPLLGSAQSFAVLGHETVTNVPSSTIYGNVGVSPGTSITGFNSVSGVAVADPQVTSGLVHSNTAVAGLALADATTAYGLLAGLSPSSTLGADLAGLVLAPGVYTVPYGVSNLTGTLTLDGGGNANAAWVFQMASSLITSPNSVVNVINTGSGAGVYWQVGSSATLDTNTTFAGNILALASISLNSTAEILCGRAFALTGQVSLIQNVISNNNTLEDFGSGREDFGSGGFSGGYDVTTPPGGGPPVVTPLPPAPVPEPATMLLLGFGLTGLVAFRKRFKKA